MQAAGLYICSAGRSILNITRSVHPGGKSSLILYTVSHPKLLCSATGFSTQRGSLYSRPGARPSPARCIYIVVNFFLYEVQGSSLVLSAQHSAPEQLLDGALNK